MALSSIAMQMLSPYERSVLHDMKGVFPRECCMCGFVGKFRAFGSPPRYDAQCPRCESLERHRLLALWFATYPEILTTGTDVLHFAPEPMVAAMLKERTNNYQSADIEPGRALLRLDIEAIDLPASSVDVIVCFDVLEHVDDGKALTELQRILRPGGVALLRTPIVEGWATTYENKSITSPADRLLHFGQADHVRYYGADVRQRIVAAGFELGEFVAVEPEVSRFGLRRGDKIFIATKADPSPGAWR